MTFNNERPTFGVKAPAATTQERVQVGNIWEKVAKESNNKYMTINLKLSKERLTSLLSSESTEIVTLKLVAFTNKYKEQDGPTSPDYKVYEDKGQ